MGKSINGKLLCATECGFKNKTTYEIYDIAHVYSTFHPKGSQLTLLKNKFHSSVFLLLTRKHVQFGNKNELLHLLWWIRCLSHYITLISTEINSLQQEAVARAAKHCKDTENKDCVFVVLPSSLILFFSIDL